MSTSNTNRVYHPLKYASEEYWGLYDLLVPILKTHFKNCKKFKAEEEAHHFLSNYNYIRKNLCKRETAADSLDKLRRAIVNLFDAFGNTPELLLEELALNHEDVLQAAKEKFMNETKLNFFSWSTVDLPDVNKAVKSLITLCEERQGLLSAIEITRRNLPEGFETV
ncbi:hypothetical protein [Tropicimonas sp. IMCC6043]|uniref:hypothetical protein n=1 Tax=Tropicimonas sp. IMCC6043 TaxID=2510645 RepID=UPI00101D2588|nr:hypothetical protein [Tropicimonas sp. IMCC6043]RYH06342.1 hypothetical protein EU800_24210 [Tropicimonas sp. IMCC6043]